MIRPPPKTTLFPYTTLIRSGDFGSYAGRVINTYEPGCWLDPGPFGCLGSGPGQALAAKLAHPDRQVVLILGRSEEHTSELQSRQYPVCRLLLENKMELTIIK